MSLPDKRRSELWSDGVHFTHAGYDLMGTLIANRLIEIITAEMEEDGGKKDEEEEQNKEMKDLIAPGRTELKKRGGR
jgi:hypothetical protein